MYEQLTKEVIKNLMFDDHKEIRERFKEKFANEINEFIDKLDKSIAYLQLFEASGSIREDDNYIWTGIFLKKSVDDLISSFHLLISGLIIPSGNLARQFYESLAMGLQCSCKSDNTLEEFLDRNKKFITTKMMNKFCEKKAEDLITNQDIIDDQITSTIMSLYKEYHKYSHLSKESLKVTYGSAKGVIFCSEYKEDNNLYIDEIRERIEGCELLGYIAKITYYNLNP